MSRSVARRNISEILELEDQFDKQRGAMDRVLASVASWIGSLPCIGIHFVWFITWILVNSLAQPRHRFDPFPFPLLGTIVSVEAVFLSTIVLVEQNWASRRDMRRDHLHLQVNLLAEQEITKVLELQRMICERLGIHEVEYDADVLAMSESTEVQDLAEELGNVMDEG